MSLFAPIPTSSGILNKDENSKKQSDLATENKLPSENKILF